MRTKAIAIAIVVGLMLGNQAVSLVHQLDADTHTTHATCEACIVSAIGDIATDNTPPPTVPGTFTDFRPTALAIMDDAETSPQQARAPPLYS